MKKNLTFLFLTLFFANFVLASPNGVGEWIEGAIEFIKNVAITGAGIIIIIGGYLMITSTGDPEKFEKGKKTLLYGAIGLVLILSAKALAEELLNLLE